MRAVLINQPADEFSMWQLLFQSLLKNINDEKLSTMVAERILNVKMSGISFLKNSTVLRKIPWYFLYITLLRLTHRDCFF